MYAKALRHVILVKTSTGFAVFMILGTLFFHECTCLLKANN